MSTTLLFLFFASIKHIKQGLRAGIIEHICTTFAKKKIYGLQPSIVSQQTSCTRARPIATGSAP
jgi:hypothetical protein